MTPVIPLSGRQINPDIVHLRPGLTLDRVRMESPSLMCQEAIALELTASSIFQTASWLDLWSTAVAKIASSDSARNSVYETAFIRLLPSGSKAVSHLTNLSANI